LSEAENLLTIEKKNSEFSAPQHLVEAEILVSLAKKNFKFFHTTRVA
jgi:hypothetical protein